MRLRVAIFLLLLMLAPLSVLAQDEPPFQVISIDSSVTGSISDADELDMWVFAGRAGVVINIEMEATDGDLAPYLALLDSRGLLYGGEVELLNSGESGSITGFELPFDGNYTIVATRQGGSAGETAGAYRLTLATDTGALAYGDFVSGEFTGEEQRYPFEGRAGDVVTISVKQQEGEFNPSVRLVDAAQTTLAENSRFNSSAEARIVEYALPADGQYEVVVAGEGDTTGGYTLHLFDRDTALQMTGENPLVPPPDYSRSAIAITLSWQGTPDFDLYVTTPDGVTLDYNTLEDGTGGLFAGDANGGCRETAPRPSETAYWRVAAPAGEYRLEVAYVLPCGEVPGEVPFTLTITQNGEVIETIEGALDQGGYTSYDWTLE